MAVPALPADVTTLTAGSSAHMNSLLDLVEFFRDTGPVFKGQGWSDSGGGSDIGVATGTNTTFGFGTAGSFKYAPAVNIGSWTVASADADPESLVVPDAGYYSVSIQAEWDSNASGVRLIRMRLNGTDIAAGSVRDDAASSGETHQSVSTIVDLAASDELDALVYQNSGSGLDCTIYLTAEWIRST